MHYVIIGGGIAGTTAAEELRKRRPEADITLVSEERHPVYSRVLLPLYVKGKIPRERVFLKKETWYADHRIEWMRGVRAEWLDARHKHVELSDGRELPYDALLIAAGGEPATSLEEPRGVSYFRTLDDADHLDQLLRTLPSDAPAAIYGGGFIAAEYANLFIHLGRLVTIAFRGPYFWSRTLDAASGALLNRQLGQRGFTLLPGAQLLSVEGEKELTALATDKGRVVCALLGVGVGVEPELGWLRGAGVETRRGVLTNEYLGTNVPGVYAAGDVTEFFDITVGRQRLAGTWQNAMSQARVAAANLAGGHEAYRLVTSYAMNVAGIEVIFIGDTDRAAAERIEVDGSVQDGGVRQRFIRRGKLVGATLVNRNADRAFLTEEIGGGGG